MSNEITTYDEEMAKFAQQVAAQERPKAGNISLKAGQVVYMGQPMPGNQIDLVVVGQAWENTYYSKPYDPNNIVSPDCYALGRAEGDEEVVMIPAANSKDIQGGPEGGCKGCPMSEWKSDPRPNSRGKACKEKRRLICIPASALSDEKLLDNAEFALVSIPVMSVANWSAYVNKVATGLKRPPWGVITNLSTTPDAKSQFKVLFNCAAKISFEGEGTWRYGMLKKKVEQAVPMLMAGYDPSETAEEAPAPVAAPKSKKF